MPRTYQELNLRDVKEGLLSIPESTLKGNSWLNGFVNSLILRITKWGNLTQDQKRVAVDNIIKYAPESELRRLDLYVEKQPVIDSRENTVEYKTVDKVFTTKLEAINAVTYIDNDETPEILEWISSKDKNDPSLPIILRTVSHMVRDTATEEQKIHLGFLVPTGQRKISPDQKILDAIKLITPYFSGDRKYFAAFRDSCLNKGYLSPKMREICISYLSNYQAQLPDDVKHGLSGIINKPSQFYNFYTLKYIKFLSELAKFACSRGFMRADKSVEEFYQTGGIGPDYRTDVYKEVVSSINKWEKVIEHVREKLLKACDKTNNMSLLAVKEYLLDPTVFFDDSINVDNIVEEFTTVFTPEVKQSALTCMRMLAGLDQDYASEWNEQGFSKAHTNIGHDLALKSELDDDEMPYVLSLCRIYRRQLPDELLNEVGVIGKKKVSKRVKVENPVEVVPENKNTAYTWVKTAAPYGHTRLSYCLVDKELGIIDNDTVNKTIKAIWFVPTRGEDVRNYNDSNFISIVNNAKWMIETKVEESYNTVQSTALRYLSAITFEAR